LTCLTTAFTYNGWGNGIEELQTILLLKAQFL
jgi:hypothetical protein